MTQVRNALLVLAAIALAACQAETAPIERASRPVEVARADAAGQRTGVVGGIEVEADGRMRERDATLIARFVGLGTQAWQAVVLGPSPSREQATVFLESLKLLR